LKPPEIILASKSPARRRILENAGVVFSWCDAGVDEDALKAETKAENRDARHLALSLAEAKACRAADAATEMACVIGCDQVLVQDGHLFDKPHAMADARVHLKTLSGNTHQLISAVCLVQTGAVIWSHIAVADMHVRPLSDAFIDTYLKTEGERILSSVGAYFLEGTGAQLFERIDGDYFTVLGLPLLPLLEELRKRGILPG